MGVVVAVVVLVVVVGMYVTWTAGRLDRLSARAETAWAALDAHLVRRAAAASDLAAHLRRHRLLEEDVAKALQHAAAAARDADVADREARENDLSRAIRDVLADLGTRPGKTEALAVELRTASTRVQLGRQFYNDAVRDNRNRRRRLVPRLLTVRHRDEPQRAFFEIDDTTAAEPVGIG